MKRRISLLLALVLLIAIVLTGCKKGENANNSDYVIKYWCILPPQVASQVKNLGDTEWAKQLEKATNVKVEFIHPTAGQEQAQFNLLLASKALPDVIEVNNYGSWYTNGPYGGLNDGVIIDLSQLINKKAPDLKKYMDMYPEVEKGMTTDDGRIHSVPFIGADNYTTFGGMILRKDLLDKFGLAVPETVDEWEKVLKTFKQNGIKYPLSLKQDTSPFYAYPLANAYGVSNEFSLGDDGKVKYGIVDGKLKEYTTLLAKWQKDGLIDSEWFAQNDQVLKSKILNNEVGAFFGFLGGDMGALITNAKKTGNNEFQLVGAKYPVLNKGELPRFTNQAWGRYRDTMASITSACKNPEFVMGWLNKAYFSGEGETLINYGVKGVSYEMKDGKEKYTELVTKNPNGLAMVEVLAKYSRAAFPHVGRTVDGYFEQYYAEPSVKAAALSFSKTDSAKYMIPKILPFTTAEKEEFDTLYSDTSKIANEDCSKIVTGVKSISEIDNTLAKIKAAGSDRVKELIQKAYDRLK